MTLKAIGFDLFGTLLQAKGNSKACLENMHKKLCEYGVDMPIERFLETFRKTHEDHRTFRLSTNREISNRSELGKVLRQLGYKIDIDSPPILEAVNAYFSSWAVTTMDGVEDTLQNIKRNFRTGVVTNFTDSIFIYKCLRDLDLLHLFDYVVVSAEVGWRKPSPKIFNKFLQLAMVEADEALFVGDDFSCDIAGAEDVGMVTVLFGGEKYDKEAECAVQPDFIISSMKELNCVVNKIIRR